MPRSPLNPSPYEVLGVAPTASHDELRRAYRRMLRETHPDTGGDAARFHAVQHAWELVGTPEDRAVYDSGRPTRGEQARATWAPAPPRRPSESRPQARTYGHPGGLSREHYLELMREWVGRGAALPDPYDPALVRSAPRDIRHLLANALAEEATATQAASLGIAYTVWHDVATDAPGDPWASKLDHVVLGPSGLFAVQSEDWGAPVRVKRNEIVGEAIAPGERPMHSLSLRAKSVARAARVKFTTLVVVVPDDAIDEALTVGRMRGLTSVVVQRSRLPGVLRGDLADAPLLGGTELFEVRTRLQASIRFT
ncbi:J domain-containing protein [Salinibacterium sp. SYSU T00001]|uniref:J domain-containing protein n=1 Tax=Homoserinimonas sedimenticola TaxID=2986805 RepID=UPI002235BE51|nr:J domain-containing protein [Salinibacterium sedimenticola]MCW4386200.1 J domain-containing protein [Salinibacterium sedimenticola]